MPQGKAWPSQGPSPRARRAWRSNDKIEAIHTVTIFCRIVDYFGDAGFCWRLAVALRALGISRVILVIDRLNILDELRGSQRIEGITVLPWNVAQAQWQASGVPQEHQADLVIEAFTCDPPPEYLQALKPSARWITLDYLATEPWADSAHGRASPHPRLKHPIAATRRWCVPGFSKGTAGLLHGSWRHISASERQQWRARLAGRAINNNTLLVMAFGYADANWEKLETLMHSELPSGFQDVVFWKPKGIEYSQSEFDEILQACDMNFVRGEDSFIRAHWAAAGPWQVPFVWQPYRQQSNAHGHKLAGWLHQLIRDPALSALQDLHWAWNGIRPVESHHELALPKAWQSFCKDFAVIRTRLHHACRQLACQPSLEANLIASIG